MFQNDGIINNDEKVSFIPSMSTSAMQQISADRIKIHIRPLKMPSNLSSNMTVTIIQDETDNTLKPQLGENISEIVNNALVNMIVYYF